MINTWKHKWNETSELLAILFKYIVCYELNLILYDEEISKKHDIYRLSKNKELLTKKKTGLIY